MRYLGGFGLLSVLAAVVIALLMQSAAMTDLGLGNATAGPHESPIVGSPSLCQVHRSANSSLIVSWNPIANAEAGIATVSVSVTGRGIGQHHHVANLGDSAQFVINDVGPTTRATITCVGTGVSSMPVTEVVAVSAATK